MREREREREREIKFRYLGSFHLKSGPWESKRVCLKGVDKEAKSAAESKKNDFLIFTFPPKNDNYTLGC